MAVPVFRPSRRTAAGLGAAAVAVIVALVAVWPAGSPAEPRRSAGPLRVSGWAPYWQPTTALESLLDIADLAADVSIVTHSTRGVTEIVPYEGLPSEAVGQYRTALAPRGVEVVATVFDDTDSGVMAGILADPSARARHVETLVNLVTEGGFAGLEIDYERFAFADPRSTWATTRPDWITFLTELAARLRPLDVSLMVAVPPVYADGGPDDPGYWVYDHAAMGRIVDRIRIMAYDYSFTDPGPIAPIDWVADVVDALDDLVPPEKLDLGIPTYGYDWVVSVQGDCPAGAKPSRRSLSIAAAQRLVAERGISTTYDEEVAERRFDYVDVLQGPGSDGAPTSCTVQRTVRYVDARGVFERARLAHRSDWHGVAMWALGNEDQATRDALRSVVAGATAWPEQEMTPTSEL